MEITWFPSAYIVSKILPTPKILDPLKKITVKFFVWHLVNT